MAYKYMLFIPILIFIGLAPITPLLDLSISKFFYYPNIGFDTQHPVYRFFYLYGEWPAYAFCGASIIALAVSFSFKCWKNIRKPALLLVFTLAIGSGLIVNALLKDHWGRTRPKQIEEFGGKSPFSPFYIPHIDENSSQKKSFPSGHAAAGFYFLCLLRIGVRQRNIWITSIGAFLVIVLGIGLSFVRIAMGGHFFSDVIASALIMWLTTLSLEWIICENTRPLRAGFPLEEG